MLTRFIPLAIAACALVAGCTTMHPRVERVAKKLDCDGSKECTVTVTVNCLHYLGCDVSVESEGKDKFVCKDAHPDFGIFKYSVNVTVKDSLFGPRGVQSLDPWVVNY